MCTQVEKDFNTGVFHSPYSRFNSVINVDMRIKVRVNINFKHFQHSFNHAYFNCVKMHLASSVKYAVLFPFSIFNLLYIFTGYLTLLPINYLFEANLDFKTHCAFV